MNEDTECEIRWEDATTFNWMELHGKDVRVFVYEEEGYQISVLYEPLVHEFFIISVKQIGENK